MICPHCNKELLGEKALVCEHCNKSLENNELNNLEEKKVDSKKKKTKIIIICAIALVILAIIVTVVLVSVFSNSGSSSTNVATSTTELSKKVCSIDATIVQFNSEDNQFIVFFGLRNEHSRYISGTGTATIVVKDEEGNELYNKEIAFDENDFGDWTSQAAGTRYLCAIYVNKSEIAGGLSERGQFILTVKGDDYNFDAKYLDTWDLPERELTINLILPTIPITINNYDRDENLEKQISITKIETEMSKSYNNKVTVNLEFNVKMLANYAEATSVSSSIGYKLKNSDGVIVDSGTIYISQMAVGETAKADKTFYDLEPDETYTLEFDNVLG